MTFNKLALVAAISAASLVGCGGDSNNSKKSLNTDSITSSITEEGVMEHLINLQRIAGENPVSDSPTRAAGTSGYDSSAAYVKAQLEAAGYEVSLQPFDFRAWEQTEYSTLLLSTEADAEGANIQQPQNQSEEEGVNNFGTMSYSGSGSLAEKASVAFVTPSFSHNSEEKYNYTDGCEDADFEGKDLTGKIAVIQRGGCTFNTKAAGAEKAGAVAVIIFNDGNGEGRTDLFGGTLGEDSQVKIPVLSASYDLGKQIFDLENGFAKITVSTTDRNVVTNNVLTETKGGQAEKVVMLGAHLDSVVEGPGINDNGSGSAGLLEYAIQLASYKDPINKVRFAWWSAEESGLVGSQYYVDSVFGELQNKLFEEIAAEKELDSSDLNSWTQEQYDEVTAEVDVRFAEEVDVGMYLNFDMIGSPNPVYFVYDGDLSHTMDDPANAYNDGKFLPPYGTADIEATFNTFFEKNGLKTTHTALSKRSDYAGFADSGIAFGGLFTGAEVAKSEEEAQVWGGEADIAYDKCYHKDCDDIQNLENVTLTNNSKALAYAGTTYAMRDQLFPDQAAEAKSRSANNSSLRAHQTVNFASRNAKFDKNSGLARYISHGHGNLYYK